MWERLLWGSRALEYCRENLGPQQIVGQFAGLSDCFRLPSEIAAGEEIGSVVPFESFRSLTSPFRASCARVRFVPQHDCEAHVRYGAALSHLRFWPVSCILSQYHARIPVWRYNIPWRQVGLRDWQLLTPGLSLLDRLLLFPLIP